MEITEGFVTEMMGYLRVRSEVAKPEIEALLSACVHDLAMNAVYVTDPQDPLTKRAMMLYCKANYGYDNDTDADRFRQAYKALRDSMGLSLDYYQHKEDTSYGGGSLPFDRD